MLGDDEGGDVSGVITGFTVWEGADVDHQARCGLLMIYEIYDVDQTTCLSCLS